MGGFSFLKNQMEEKQRPAAKHFEITVSRQTSLAAVLKDVKRAGSTSQP